MTALTPPPSLQPVLDWLDAHVARSARLQVDSRRVMAGDVFLARASDVAQRESHVRQACAAGAAAVLIDGDLPLTPLPVAACAVPGLKQLEGWLADAWYGHPSRRLTVVAVTGTNGKTSCTQWIGQALRQLGIACGVIGTLGIIGPDGRVTETGLTTPQPVDLHAALRDWADAGVAVAALEASSIGLAEERMAGLHIRMAGFTNLTRDHLDYHGTMEAYEAEKRRLFQWPTLERVIINRDDPAGHRMLAAVDSRVVKIAYSLEADAAPNQVVARDIGALPAGTAFTLALGDAQQVPVSTALLGYHNVANLLLVAGVLDALQIDPASMAQALGALVPPPGRLEVLDANAQAAPLVVVDYAHTPDALAQALRALRPVAQARGGRLWCVFGCGGDRDRGKRPQMAAIASLQADVCVLTSDNPRSERVEDILADMRPGLAAGRPAQTEPERRLAVMQSIGAADEHDVVLLAGKGHEAYQEVRGQKLAYSDVLAARQALWLRGAGWPDLAALARLLDAHLLHAPDASMQPTGLGTDTRQSLTGRLFLALRGERHDGHDHAAQALAAGALALIVERELESAPQLVVKDSRAALLQLGALWRLRHALPVAAVVGSNGKTTTKTLLASIARQAFGADQVLATQGNLNNEIGVPLTLLGLQPMHQAAVIEIGINHHGEMPPLAAAALPTVTLITNAQREHQEHLGSIEGSARENGAAITALALGGTAVFPADDAMAPIWREMAAGRTCLEFGTHPAAAVRATDIQEDLPGPRFMLHLPDGSVHPVQLGILGRHNVMNALGAAAAAWAMGMNAPAIVAGLQGCRPVKGRLVTHRLKAGGWLIDDSYNANPDSVLAAIEVLASLPAEHRLLVLGDMGEVGEQGPAFHAEVGERARARGIHSLLALGELSREAVRAFGPGAWLALDVNALNARVAEHVQRPGSLVLVKGSRFMRMERVVEALMPHFEEAADHAA